MAGQKNLKKVNKNLQNVKLENFQLIENEKHDNYIKLQYGGFELPISQMSGKDVLDLLADLYEAKTQSEVQALMCGKSVATMKVNDAYGRTAIDMQKHYIEQRMTYADGFGSQIKVKGRTLKNVLTDLIDLTETHEDIYGVNTYELKVYKNMLKHWHADADAVFNKIINKSMFIHNGYVYSYNCLYNLIKNWAGENNIKIEKEKINKAIQMFGAVQ